jgi:type VI protein secretion system component VasF
VSRDPWLALEAQRRRRHWKQWPWGLIALGLAVLFTVGMFGLVLIGRRVRAAPG